MKIEDFIRKEFHRKLEDRRCLVVYDPDERYREVLGTLADDSCVVIDCGGSVIESREQAMEVWNRIGRGGDGPKTMALHIPSALPSTDEGRFADPFTPFALAGISFPEGDAESYRTLAERALPDYAGRVRELFKEGEPSFSVLNALEGGKTWPRLREMLRVESAAEILTALLAPDDRQEEAMKANEDWIPEALELAKETLGFQPRTKSRKWENLQRELWRWLLFSEFSFDLPEALPESLENVGRATDEARPLIFSVCDRLRSGRETLKVYLSRAEETAAELGLEEKTEQMREFGERTTFAFEERSLLTRYVDQAKVRDWQGVAETDALRRRSVWADESSRQSAWTLAERAIELIQTAESLRPEIADLGNKAEEIIAYYGSRGHRLDSLHRAFEQAWTDPMSEADSLDELIAEAVASYRKAADALHARFVTAVERQGWPVNGLPRATTIFQNQIAPHLETKGRKVALFMVDALRYELASTLASDLQARYPTTLTAVCAQLPTITVVGMATLLPRADQELELEKREAKLIPHIARTPIVTPDDRLHHVRSVYGDRCEMIDLEDLVRPTAGKKKKPAIRAETDLLIVKTREIDDQGEIGATHIHTVLPRTMERLRVAMSRLEKLGFHHVVVCADHGFVLTTGEGERDFVDVPEGDWVRKNRCLVGDGQISEDMLAFSADQAGIKGNVRRYVTPRALCAFKRGLAYWHEGLSLQECVIPVLEVELQKATREEPAAVDIQISYRGRTEATVTTRRPVVETAVFGTDLFGAGEAVFRLEAVSGKKVVGEPAASEHVDSTTGLVKLGHGKAVKIPLRLEDDFQGACEVRAIDPETGVIHGTPLKLKLRTLE